MKTIKTVEQEINKIRLEIFEETKDMTLEQRKKRLSVIVGDAQKEFGFRRVTDANIS
jgi:hypothetical protein